WSLESLKNLRVVSQLQGTAANRATTPPWLTPGWVKNGGAIFEPDRQSQAHLARDWPIFAQPSNPHSLFAGVFFYLLQIQQSHPPPSSTISNWRDRVPRCLRKQAFVLCVINVHLHHWLSASATPP
ncbi:hypothetical protein PspLS_05678, partial [Pyricularia sp. CBS 133598]